VWLVIGYLLGSGKNNCSTYTRYTDFRRLFNLLREKIMTRFILVISLLFLASIPLTVIAQEEEEETTPNFSGATYFYCPVSKQEAADVVVKTKFAPIYNAAVEAGTINSWGWLAHRSGGKWRRILYITATGIDALLDASDALFEATRDAMGDDKTFGESCPSHDDYIWQSDNVGGGEERGEAGFSVYFYCDQNREDRADEIVSEFFAPIYDKQVEEGKIASWGWLEHFVGGKIRRLLTITGASHKSNLAARAEAIEAVFGNDNKAGAEFGSICTDHVDYMWDIQIEKP